MSKQSGRGALAALLSLCCATGALAQEEVSFDPSVRPGTIVVVAYERRLYFVTDQGQAIRYPVGVGQAGKQWRGASYCRRQICQSGLVAAGGHVKRDHRDA